MEIETEIKFTIPDKEIFNRVPKCTEIASYTTVDRGVKQHIDTYFDTDGFRLYHEKVVFRLRTSENRTILVCKTQIPSENGIYRREETEAETDCTPEEVCSGNIPDLQPFRILHDLLGDVRLIQSLCVINNRHTILLCRNDEPYFELVLDDVTFTGHGGTHKVLELEVESITGTTEDLHHIGKWLSDRFDLKPAGPSKYILGMDLVGNVE
ncbi:MAG: CYTH domain-containing protein [Candidatus Latescibacteria bacterium]|nr:CYTH domain-containing protein [Candidatus Latescibacterota bacterium]